MTDKPLPNRQTPFSEPFKAFIPEGWAPYPPQLPAALPAASHTAARRAKLCELFPGERLVVPAGPLKARSNDCDYRFRPHSAFAHLTGLGTDREPNAVLVIEPDQSARLYFHPRVPRTDPEFYSDSTYGEMWVGQRESLEEMGALCGLPCASIDQLDGDLAKPGAPLRIIRDADPSLTAKLDALRADDCAAERDAEFQTAASELRLVKDEFEIAQLRQACADTAVGFEAVVRQLPEAIRRGRGERWVEGVFGLHARHLGNCTGYDSIVASGDHANTLHWIKNDGAIRPGDLLLLDAGVEAESLYTADITRTLPVDGAFSDAQREVYQAVRDAQQAGMDAALAGAKFADIHAAAIGVVAQRLADWGVLPVGVEQSLDEEAGGHHRRWMVHGTSHHLGIDVHDCAQARFENYRGGTLRPGMVVTVEPGIYFKASDLLAPPEFRGVGVRIEDDVLITDGPCDILSSHLPREADAVEAWMARVWAS
ncbi:MAG: aminopeptidase P family protein [Propionibacteriaceae bacterium]|nr:aminopeptidase P family protein [Propionibacteriaceae bacterium]